MNSPLIMDVADVVAWEQRIAQAGLPLSELMERAGSAVTDAVMDASAPGANILILAGSGNNGGDGWVVARMLAQARYAYPVPLVPLVPPSEITAQPARDAASKLEGLIAQGLQRIHVCVSPSPAELALFLRKADVIVDALLGTGFAHDEVREPMASLIAAANAERARRGGIQIIAIDCPSGLNAQTGHAADACIEADKTVTMLAIKPGLISERAPLLVGSIKLATLEPLPVHADK